MKGIRYATRPVSFLFSLTTALAMVYAYLWFPCRETMQNVQIEPVVIGIETTDLICRYVGIWHWESLAAIFFLFGLSVSFFWTTRMPPDAKRFKRKIFLWLALISIFSSYFFFAFLYPNYLKTKRDPEIMYEQYTTVSAAELRSMEGNGFNPLGRAAKDGDIDRVRFFIEHHARINLQNPQTVSPLWIAASFGHAEVVRLLLEKGADFTLKSADNETPLTIAITKNRPAVVAAILEKISDFSPASSVGDLSAPALFERALVAGNIKIIEIFLAKGFKADGISETGKTYVQLANDAGRSALAEFLTSKGGPKDFRKEFSELFDGTVEIDRLVENGTLVAGEFRFFQPGKGGNFFRFTVDGRILPELPKKEQLPSKQAPDQDSREKWPLPDGGEIVLRDGANDGFNLVYLDAKGNEAPNFKPFEVSAPDNFLLQIDPKGRLLLALLVREGSEVSRATLARYTSDGREDKSFKRFEAKEITSITLQGDGKVLLGGFSSPQYRTQGLFRLLPDGSPDTLFNETLGTGLRGKVEHVGVDAKGNITVAGDILAVGGRWVGGLALLQEKELNENFAKALETALSPFGYDARFKYEKMEKAEDGAILVRLHKTYPQVSPEGPAGGLTLSVRGESVEQVTRFK